MTDPASLPSIDPAMLLQIHEAEERLEQAMLHSDVPALESLLADALIFTNHLGQVMGKQEDLAAHRSGLLKLREIAASDRRVQLHGPVAVVAVRVRIAGEYGGQPANGDFRFTRVWARGPANEDWQVVAAHSVMVV